MSSPSLDSDLLTVTMLRFATCGPFSFTLHSGCCAGLSGPSGVGKTLLLRALADIDRSEGQVLLKGRARSLYEPHDWRRLVALVPAESRWWHPRVGDHLPPDSNKEQAAGLIGACGFDTDVLSWQVSRLSTGEKQRLSVVRAMIRKPVILLLDEVGSGLDPDNSLILESLVADYLSKHQGAAIWVSHNQEQLDRVAALNINMRRGELQIEELDNRDDVSEGI